MSDLPPLDLTRLHAAYASGALSPQELIESLLPRLAASDADAVWITRVPDAELRTRAAALGLVPAAERGALWGVPFAVKDNIDVAGMPTTAACPDFAYVPTARPRRCSDCSTRGRSCSARPTSTSSRPGSSASGPPTAWRAIPSIRRSSRAGRARARRWRWGRGSRASRSGPTRRAPGSVPAAFNNIVGLKPTKGLIPTQGVVPACRSLDCISIFALTAADAAAVLDIAGGFEAADPFSRTGPQLPSRGFAGLAVGVPKPEQRLFFGDAAAEALYDAALARAASLGARLVEFDLAPFLETAALLYAGPWVAERAAAVGGFLASHPDSVWPTTRAVIETGRPLQRRRRVRGRLSPGRADARLRAGLAGDRRHAAADGADDLPGRRDRRRADPAQQPAGHLHQLRQPARPCRPGPAGRVPAGRPAAGSHPGGAGLERPAAGGAWSELAALDRAAARRHRRDTAGGGRPRRRCAGIDRGGGGRRPSVRRAAQPSAGRAGRQLVRATRTAPATVSTRYPGRPRPSPAWSARPAAARHRGRGLAAQCRGLGPPAGRHPGAAGIGTVELRTAARSRGFCAKATR